MGRIHHRMRGEVGTYNGRVTMRVIFLLLAGAMTLASQGDRDWQSVFTVDKKNLGVQGLNAWMPLTPGYRLTYKHGSTTIVDMVLTETKVIDGVETRVVEDRETKNGGLVELTHDYYAIDSATNDVYYFGEEVDVYKDGKVVSHEGTWLSGVKGAKFGLFMPAAPRVGQKFYQELAPGVGMDRVEIVSDSERVTTPAGTFEKCVHVRETTPLEKGVTDHKWYAAGVGPVKDGNAALVEYGQKQRERRSSQSGGDIGWDRIQ